MILADREEGRYRETLLEALRQNPGEPQFTYHMALLKQGDGDLDGALALYKQTIKGDKEFWQAYNNTGVILRDRGNVLEAEADFKTAFAISRDGIVAANIRDLWLRGCPQATNEDHHLVDVLNPSVVNRFSYRGGVAYLSCLFFGGMVSKPKEMVTQGLTVDKRYAIVSKMSRATPEMQRAMEKAVEGAPRAVLGKGALQETEYIEYNDLEGLFRVETVRRLRDRTHLGLIRTLPVNRFVENQLREAMPRIGPIEICKYKSTAVPVLATSTDI